MIARRLSACALLTIALVVNLGGCGSAPKETARPPTELQSLNRSANLAFAQGRYAQAVTLYGAALDEALAADAPRAIVDARFNIALAQMYLGDYPAALAQVAQADAERERRGLGADPELRLLEATIRYRAGELASAETQLEALLGTAALDPATAAKAHFVGGLVAADRNDRASLQRHLSALSGAAEPAVEADRLELDGRRAALDGNGTEALGMLERSALLRSAQRDYRGMARVLAAAGALAEGEGADALAAAYYLRAGRSAAQRGEADARYWLERARVLGQRSGDQALADEAAAALARLVEAPP